MWGEWIKDNVGLTVDGLFGNVIFLVSSASSVRWAYIRKRPRLGFNCDCCQEDMNHNYSSLVLAAQNRAKLGTLVLALAPIKLCRRHFIGSSIEEARST